ncbi:hypothetical protein EVAR_91068_1 [Eumeta japonica]|uniref:Uncharacterized protein n=1 Tax=Eumeta variegata TaxID=151549 RepID=A0A4C1SPY3_EUMVA|nr:hypothetical protein EVAR_91068_1 [Eumeta japonica]
MMNEAVHHASTTYQQPSFNRIFSADIQRLVSEREREGVATQISQHKARLRECTTQLRNLLASEKLHRLKNIWKILMQHRKPTILYGERLETLKGQLSSSRPTQFKWRLGTKRL